MRLITCNTCGALGHGSGKDCPLRRLNEQQTATSALGVTREAVQAKRQKFVLPEPRTPFGMVKC